MRVRRARAALVARRSFVEGVARERGARSRASDSLERGSVRSTGGSLRSLADLELFPDLPDLPDFPDLSDLADLWDLSEVRRCSVAR